MIDSECWQWGSQPERAGPTQSLRVFLHGAVVADLGTSPPVKSGGPWISSRGISDRRRPRSIRGGEREILGADAVLLGDGKLGNRTPRQGHDSPSHPFCLISVVCLILRYVTERGRLTE